MNENPELTLKMMPINHVLLKMLIGKGPLHMKKNSFYKIENSFLMN